MLQIKNQFGRGHWCILGDFNAVRKMEERRGSLNMKIGGVEMIEINSFIQNMELEDIPLVGRRYTLYKPNSCCKSKLDRFLVSKEWIENWPGSIIPPM